MTEDTVHVAAQKGWKNFEAYARNILRRVYARFQLEIKDTPWSHDGGRDGEAVYIFAPAGVDGIADDLAIVVKLWVEVKLRHGTAVNLHDAGSHLVRAENQKVNKLVFVTNGRFAAETLQQLSIYCMNRHLSCAFLDGARLEELRRETAKDRTLPANHKDNGPFTGSLELLVRLSNDPLPRDLHVRGQVCSKPEVPVFLILDLIVREDQSTLSLPSINPPPGVEDCLLYQSSLCPPLFSGERFRVVYALWAQPGARFKPADFEIVFEGVPSNAITLRNDTGEVMIGERFLVSHRLASQDRVAAPLRKSLARWQSNGGHSVVAIEAPAGAGKSYVVHELRRNWLRKGIREVWLDGGFHNNAWEVVRGIAAAIFPLSALSAADGGKEVLEFWLKDAGIADAGFARTVSQRLTNPGNDGAPKWSECVEIVSTLLRQGSAQTPIVVVYEDMHKASPTAILLMRATLGRISYEGAGNSFILLTTRPTDQVWSESQQAGFDSDAGPSTVGSPLDQLLADLSQEGKMLKMERPDLVEARALLASSLPHAEEQVLDSIVDQVGTTPFALKELIAYLVAVEAVEPVGPGLWHLVSPQALRSRADLDDLRHATADRLTLLLRRYEGAYPWLDDFLLAGALLGRNFESTLACRASGAPIGQLPSAVLDILFSADVAQPATFKFESEELRFTHDLIRLAFLKRRPWPVAMRLASRLLQFAPAEMPTLLRCRLARNAGDVAGCSEIAKSEYENAHKHAQYWEALQFGLLALWAIDAARASQLLDTSGLIRFIAIDPALALGPIVSLETRSRHEVLAIIFECLETVVKIGFGGGRVVEALMNEAELLVRLVGTLEQKARLRYYAGRFAFDVDDFSRSLENHAAGERIHFSNNKQVSLVWRQENLNRIFLCQRQLGLTSEAEQTLNLLEEFGSGDLPEYEARMLAYRGYLSFYSDLPSVPQYWQRAAEIARAEGNYQRFVHHEIGRAYVLLLLNNLTEAREAFEAAQSAIKGGSQLHGVRLRLDLDAGALALVEQNFSEAEARLLEAQSQGLQLDVFRRLWRIEANLANLFEVKGDMERCHFYERRALRGILVRASAERPLGGDAPWLHQRHVLPVLNLALRIREGVSSLKLMDAFTDVQQAEINRLVDLVQKADLNQLPNGLNWHCKRIAGRDRFIPTE